MPRLIPLVVVVLFLAAACQPRSAPATSSDPVTRAAAGPSTPRAVAPFADAIDQFDPDLMQVELFGDGLSIEDGRHGWPLRLDQSTRAFVMRGMAAFGTPRASDGPADCPAGKLAFLDYPNGLELAFRDDTLVGYWVREGAQGIATARGVKPGSPRSALGDARVAEASFGSVADLDGVFAILDEQQQTVTDLYAGAACIYD